MGHRDITTSEGDRSAIGGFELAAAAFAYLADEKSDKTRSENGPTIPSVSARRRTLRSQAQCQGSPRYTTRIHPQVPRFQVWIDVRRIRRPPGREAFRHAPCNSLARCRSQSPERTTTQSKYALFLRDASRCDFSGTRARPDLYRVLPNRPIADCRPSSM